MPLADRVAAELDGLFKASAYQAEDDLVFGHPHSGRPLDRTSVTTRFQRVCERAGIRDDVVFHDLRHTFGTMMAAAGVPLRTLQGWMGHADIKTTSIYMHFAPAEDEVQTANRVFPQPGEPAEARSRPHERGGFISKPPSDNVIECSPPRAAGKLRAGVRGRLRRRHVQGMR